MEAGLNGVSEEPGAVHQVGDDKVSFIATRTTSTDATSTVTRSPNLA